MDSVSVETVVAGLLTLAMGMWALGLFLSKEWSRMRDALFFERLARECAEDRLRDHRTWNDELALENQLLRQMVHRDEGMYWRVCSRCESLIEGEGGCANCGCTHYKIDVL